jgi:hypothetical protein
MLFRLAVMLSIACVGAVGGLAWEARTADSDTLPRRATLAFIARDESGPTAVPKPTPFPPGPGYCLPSSDGAAAPYPPNAVFGLLTIAGADAPAGTFVTLTFNGLPGLYAFTTVAGGYRFNYAGGGQGHDPPCINEVGKEIGLLVNGVHTSSGHSVGPSAGLALRFDVAIP